MKLTDSGYHNIILTIRLINHRSSLLNLWWVTITENVSFFLIKCGGSILKTKPNPDAEMEIQKESSVNLMHGVKSSHCVVLVSQSMNV